MPGQPSDLPPAIPRLMLVTNRRRSRRSVPELVAAAVAGGGDAVQLREPDLPRPDLLDLAAAVLAAIDGRAALQINGDLDLAAALGAGLHLPEAAPVPALARRRLGPNALIGRSVHTPAAAAAATGVDYLVAGHVYPTVSKPGRPPLGLDGLRAIVAASPVPVIAIGGITAGRAGEVLATGAAGLAVIGAIADSADPERAAAELRAAITTAEREEQSMPQPTAAPATTEIAVVINGKPATLAAGETIHSFITGKGFTAEMVIVELNGEIVPRPQYPATTLATGDRLEIVHAVGGG